MCDCNCSPCKLQAFRQREVVIMLIVYMCCEKNLLIMKIKHMFILNITGKKKGISALCQTKLKIFLSQLDLGIFIIVSA